MSADNGIYILVTPITDSKVFEYRVAHCQAIENIDYDPKYLNLYFGECSVFLTKTDALREAAKQEEEIMTGPMPILEYGIQFIRLNTPFPTTGT